MATLINLNGAIVPPERAAVSVFDRGFLYGDSVYEVLRTYGGRLFAASEHLDRLARSAESIEMALPDRAWLEAQVRATLDQAACAEAYVRVIVTRGEGPLNLDPATASGPFAIVIVKPLEPFPEWMYTRGVRVAIPAQRRTPCALSGAAKTGNYLGSVLALGEARRAGFDDALLLDLHGRLSEASAANVFLVRGGSLWTPSLEAGLLRGVTRDAIFAIGAAHGIPVREAELWPRDLIGAEEVLLTSTLREVMPVVQVDEHPIGGGRTGPLAAELRRLLQEHARRSLQLDAPGSR